MQSGTAEHRLPVCDLQGDRPGVREGEGSMGFDGIIGHESVVAHFQKAILGGKVGHAYLIAGPEGSGKRMLADAFAGTLQCSEGKEDMCGKCHSCHQALTMNHPDIIYVRHEKPNTITVDEIRAQLVSDAQIRPYNGKYKIYIVEDSEKMNPEAQNALLKTLEEPPEYVVILLLAANSASLLDTILSRCVVLNLAPVRTEVIERYLMEKMELPDYKASVCAAFCGGAVGRAIDLAGSEYFQQVRDKMVFMVTHLHELGIVELTAHVRDIAKWKVTIQDFLDLMAVWYRDVLYFKATRDADGIIFKDQIQRIKNAAGGYSYEGLEEVQNALSRAVTRLNANVNFELTMQLLFMTLKENGE